GGGESNRKWLSEPSAGVIPTHAFPGSRTARGYTWRLMLYEQLRAFHAVASEGGFTRAAEALHRTQPAVSAQVKALESRYGVALFERLGRGVTITEFGQRLFEITRRMFALEGEADHALRSARTPRFKSLKIAA